MRKLSVLAVLGASLALAAGCAPQGGADDVCSDGPGSENIPREYSDTQLKRIEKLETRVAAIEAKLAAGGAVTSAPAAVAAPAAGSGVLPQIGPPNPAKNTWKCVKVAKGPRIDGKLDDAAWRKALQVKLVAESGGRLANDGAVLICHDTKNFYIAAICMETDMDKLKTKCTKRDEKVYGDDCVEFYIDHDSDKQDAVKFVVNANGVFMDFIRLRRGDGDDVTWNPTIKTAKLADRFILEIAVPLADMKIDYKPGASMSFNALRMRNKAGGRMFEASTWWGKINRIESLGKVTLE